MDKVTPSVKVTQFYGNQVDLYSRDFATDVETSRLT